MCNVAFTYFIGWLKVYISISVICVITCYLFTVLSGVLYDSPDLAGTEANEVQVQRTKFVCSICARYRKRSDHICSFDTQITSKMPDETKVIQITNLAPTATKEQMKILFTFIGKLDEVRMYPERYVNGIMVSKFGIVYSSQRLRAIMGDETMFLLMSNSASFLFF